MAINLELPIPRNTTTWLVAYFHMACFTLIILLGSMTSQLIIYILDNSRVKINDQRHLFTLMCYGILFTAAWFGQMGHVKAEDSESDAMVSAMSSVVVAILITAGCIAYVAAARAWSHDQLRAQLMRIVLYPMDGDGFGLRDRASRI
ncbi:hypothetical protein LTS10_006892 [Elasticomyces elasticus]|nr:hypothetical protein LTS10_006892 [Elasticomyces elasticus]